MRRDRSLARAGVVTVALACCTALVLLAGCTTAAWGAWTVLDPPVAGSRSLPFSPQAIDCGGPASCLAFGTTSDDGAAVWDGTAWRRIEAPAVSFGGVLRCASPTWCVVVTRDGSIVWDGTGWSPSPIAGEFEALDCPVAGTCFAADIDSPTGAQLLRWDGATWIPVPGATGIPTDTSSGYPAHARALSCSSANGCTIVVESMTSDVWHWRAGSLTRLTAPGAPSWFDAVDCTSDSHCVTVGWTSDDQDERMRAVVGTWSRGTFAVRELAASADASPLRQVDCVDETSCVATGYAGTAVLDSAGWRMDPDVGGTSVLACPAALRCFSIMPGTGTPTTTAGYPQLAAWDGSTWSLFEPTNLRAMPDARFTDVSCVTSGWCLSVGSYVDGFDRKVLAMSFDGQRWARLPDVPIPGSTPEATSAVDCGAAGTCAVAVNTPTGSYLATWNRSRWGVAPVRPAGASSTSIVLVDDVACGGPSSCLAIGNVYRTRNVPGTPFALGWDGTSWSPRQAPTVEQPLAGPVRTGRLSCASPTFCARVDIREHGVEYLLAPVQAWDGRSWRSLSNPFWLVSTAYPRDIDCATATSCAVSATVNVPNPDGLPVEGALFYRSPLVATWNGLGWARTPLPVPSAPERLWVEAPSVSCSSATTCVVLAEGSMLVSDTSVPGLLGWQSSGSTWTMVDSPVPLSSTSGVDVVSCSSDVCQAVGTRFYDGAVARPTAYRVAPPVPAR